MNTTKLTCLLAILLHCLQSATAKQPVAEPKQPPFDAARAFDTAMALLVRDTLARTDDARALLREIFTTEADLIPNDQDHTLTVHLHHLTNALSDQAARALAVHLNESETLYPGTNLRLLFKLVSDENPPDQEF